jgi:hypothetical protein
MGAGRHTLCAKKIHKLHQSAATFANSRELSITSGAAV